MSKKNKIILATVVAMVAMIGVFLLFVAGVLKVPSIDLKPTTKVTITDGVAVPGQLEYEIEIPDTDTYSMYAGWEAEKPGLLTGCRILNEAGELVNAFTAESMTMSQAEVELQEGTYTVQLRFLTSSEAVKAFFEEYGVVREEMDVPYEEEDPYAYAQNGTWNMTYEFRWMEKDAPLTVGMVLGLLLGLMLVVLLLTVTKKGEDTRCKFDERQELLRGRGFKYGFFAMLISLFVLYILGGMDMISPWLAENQLGVILVVGMVVCICYCIWNDAYFALNENRTMLVVVFIAAGLINLGLGIGGIVKSISANAAEHIVSQPFSSMNLLVGIMFVIIAVALLAKKVLKDGKDE